MGEPVDRAEPGLDIVDAGVNRRALGPASSTSASASLTPAAWSVRATPSPIPLAAPVTMPTLPARPLYASAMSLSPIEAAGSSPTMATGGRA